MNNPFSAKLHRLVKQRGFPSMSRFYAAHRFSFSYEYLRQMLHGIRVPSNKIVAELAARLGIEEAPLRKWAAAERLDQKIARHYQLPDATQPRHLAETVKRYRKEGRFEARLLRLVRQLGPAEREQLIKYLVFLRQQCRKKIVATPSR